MASDGPRYRVLYRLGGSGPGKYAGSFKTKEEAEIRKRWILREIAAMRNPDIKSFSKPLVRESPPQTFLPVLSFEERGEGMNLMDYVKELEGGSDGRET